MMRVRRVYRAISYGSVVMVTFRVPRPIHMGISMGREKLLSRRPQTAAEPPFRAWVTPFRPRRQIIWLPTRTGIIYATAIPVLASRVASVTAV